MESITPDYWLGDTVVYIRTYGVIPELNEWLKTYPHAELVRIDNLDEKNYPG